MTMLAFTMNAQQRFFNLTAEEVRIDSVLPVFAHSFPLGDNYADSTYKVSIVYPEFIPMSDADLKKYQTITNAELTGLFLINCTMPITLYWANALLKGYEGLAFGLLAAALIPGYLLATF